MVQCHFGEKGLCCPCPTTYWAHVGSDHFFAVSAYTWTCHLKGEVVFDSISCVNGWYFSLAEFWLGLSTQCWMGVARTNIHISFLTQDGDLFKTASFIYYCIYKCAFCKIKIPCVFLLVGFVGWVLLCLLSSVFETWEMTLLKGQKQRLGVEFSGQCLSWILHLNFILQIQCQVWFQFPCKSLGLEPWCSNLQYRLRSYAGQTGVEEAVLKRQNHFLKCLLNLNFLYTSMCSFFYLLVPVWKW